MIIPPSGLYYPNRIARIFLSAVEETVGKARFRELLQACSLESYLSELPPDNLNREFDFADFSKLIAVLDDTVAVKAARASYWGGLKAFGGLAGMGALSVALQALGSEMKVKYGLISMTNVFSTLSDQTSEVEEEPDRYLYRILRCPVCWGRQGDHAMCAVAGAMIEEGLYWATEERYPVIEISCCAKGDQTCTFAIPRAPSP